MSQTVTACIFCDIGREKIFLENEHAFVIRDSFPVTQRHSLVIPKRHVADFFDLTEEEVLACYTLLKQARMKILKQDESVNGFNVGINSGAEAGQTIFHCHIHLIPRRKGDVDAPRGGVRHLIPGKGSY